MNSMMTKLCVCAAGIAIVGGAGTAIVHKVKAPKQVARAAPKAEAPCLPLPDNLKIIVEPMDPLHELESGIRFTPAATPAKTEVHSVPEPLGVGLLGLGLAVAMAWRRARLRRGKL